MPLEVERLARLASLFFRRVTVMVVTRRAPFSAMTSTGMMLVPVLSGMAAEAWPLTTTAPITVMVALDLAAVGVTVVETTALATVRR